MIANDEMRRRYRQYTSMLLYIYICIHHIRWLNNSAIPADRMCKC